MNLRDLKWLNRESFWQYRLIMLNYKKLYALFSAPGHGLSLSISWPSHIPSMLDLRSFWMKLVEISVGLNKSSHKEKKTIYRIDKKMPVHNDKKQWQLVSSYIVSIHWFIDSWLTTVKGVCCQAFKQRWLSVFLVLAFLQLEILKSGNHSSGLSGDKRISKEPLSKRLCSLSVVSPSDVYSRVKIILTTTWNGYTFR